MINVLVIVTFLVCFLAAFLAKKLGLVTVYFALLPELMSGLALLVVLGRLMVGKRLQLDYKYFVFMALLPLTMAMGVVLQSVPLGPVVAGIRDYVPMLSLLLLGAIYPFTAQQIRKQIIVLILLLAIQVPIAVYQRFWQFAHKMHTGDVVMGTVTNSGMLSVLMIVGVTLMTVLYLRRRLSLLPYLAITAFLLVPTGLNETKATMAILPIGMLAPVFFMRRSEQAWRRLLPLVAIFAVSGAGFIASYNYLMQAHRNPDNSLQDFWLEGRVQDYLYRGALEGDPRIGRFDSMHIALRTLSETPARTAFGLGIGNVSPSTLPGFDGEYAHYYGRFKVSFTQVTLLLWNMGVVGVLLYGLLYYALFRDALTLVRAGGVDAAIGQCWAPLVIIGTMALFYNSVLAMDELMYPFMLYGGIVARRAYQVRRAKRRAPAAASTPTERARAESALQPS